MVLGDRTRRIVEHILSMMEDKLKYGDLVKEGVNKYVEERTDQK